MIVEKIGNAVVINTDLFHYEQIGSVAKLVVNKKVDSLRILKTTIKQFVKTLNVFEKDGKQ